MGIPRRAFFKLDMGKVEKQINGTRWFEIPTHDSKTHTLSTTLFAKD